MATEIQMTFRHVDSSPTLVALIEQEVHRLYRCCGEISELSVVVERPHHRHHKGDHFRVRISFALNGHPLVASRAPDACARHSDLNLAVVDAFRSAQRLVSSRRKRQMSRRQKHLPLVEAEAV